jgi:hypothetical protein
MNKEDILNNLKFLSDEPENLAYDLDIISEYFLLLSDQLISINHIRKIDLDIIDPFERYSQLLWIKKTNLSTILCSFV